MGINSFYQIAIEYQEYDAELHEQSIKNAEVKTIALVKKLHEQIA